ncbi:SH3-domain-containing protein [Rhodotorula sp. JG-1b]|nr:SH3-domain-containing protein [Rhodotorula sp. JG-1b]
MAASVPSSGSLITHLVSRIESDLTFLASHNLVTAPELQQIRSTLAEAQVRANGAALELLALGNDPAASNNHTLMPVVPAVQQRQTVTPPKAQCKAVWDYTKSQPDDLGFKAGDVITIEAEENPDWWRGSLNGQTGLFPSNHVERLPASSSSAVPPPPPRIKEESPALYAQPPPPPSNSWSPSPAPYAYQQPQNYGGGGPNSANEKQTQPPPAPQWNGIPSYAQVPPPPPPPQQQVVVSQDAPGVKKNKFGGLGKTVGTAFAGGLGFGAGSAIANDAINAIF